MDDCIASLAPISVPGLSVSLDADLHCLSLRYFDPDGPMANRVRAIVNRPLPAPLAALRSAAEGGELVILAWRSPTETLVLCRSRALLTRIQADAGGRAEGCCVDQSGGIRALFMTGPHSPSVFARLGAAESMPATGQAVRSRLAEVPVLALSIVSGEYLLLVERVYAPHLIDWMRETAVDLDDARSGEFALFG